MRRATVILNPGARSGRGQRRWGLWQERLRDSDLACSFVQPDSMAHIEQLAAVAQADVVVAVGGDGTINAALNGVLTQGAEAPALAVLYAGTSPDFCRFHGIPTAPEAALDALLNGRICSRDVGRVQYRDGSGAECTSYFGCSVNLGIGATVAARANRWRRFLGDAGGTGLAVLSALPGPHRCLELSVDGEAPVILPRCCHLCIAKSPWIASGLKFTGDLRPADGRLAVLAIADKSLFGLLRLLPAFYSGTVSSRPDVLFRFAQSVSVQGRGAVEFDGDPHGTLPIAVDIRPGALRLVVPEAS